MTPAEMLFKNKESFTPGEFDLLKMQFDLHKPGSFKYHLFSAFVAADSNNRESLSKGFPELAAALDAWQHGDLAQRARELGIDV